MSHRHRKWPGVVYGWLDARGRPEPEIDWSYENGIPNLEWQRSWISEGQQEVGCGERGPFLCQTLVLLNGAFKSYVLNDRNRWMVHAYSRWGQLR